MLDAGYNKVLREAIACNKEFLRYIAFRYKRLFIFVSVTWCQKWDHSRGGKNCVKLSLRSKERDFLKSRTDLDQNAVANCPRTSQERCKKDGAI